MNLPFTHDQFLDVFAAYHRLLWPGAALLWVITLAAAIRWWRVGPRASRLVAAVLALHWAWSAILYHWAFFRSVNPAAPLFAVLFLAQAGLFAWQGVVRQRLVFTPSRSGWGAAAAALMVYALVYPALGLMDGLSWPRLPTFGVPCPTLLLTAGALLLLPREQMRPLAIVPVIWAAVGGSAAFALGIRADLALPVAGAMLLVRVLPRGR